MGNEPLIPKTVQAPGTASLAPMPSLSTVPGMSQSLWGASFTQCSSLLSDQQVGGCGWCERLRCRGSTHTVQSAQTAGGQHRMRTPLDSSPWWQSFQLTSLIAWQSLTLERRRLVCLFVLSPELPRDFLIVIRRS